jgi:23S rRNA (adenine2503-C2)-methyltransferase
VWLYILPQMVVRRNFSLLLRQEWSLMEPIDIKSLMPDELEDFLKSLGQPSYKAHQIFSWIHKGVASYDEMTDISKDLRILLKETTKFSTLIVKKTLVSDIDSTVKYLYELFDKENIESVLMNYKYGNTVCISTQAGCRMNCDFCASTIGGLKRNLTASEMLDQVLVTMRQSGQKISNVVLMGIGEPLDNYDNVLKFLKLLTCQGGLNISLRHVSLSTCGLVDKIYDLMREKLGLTLSVSLHAPNNEIRSKIMPINKKYNIETLLAACNEYADTTKRRISFEYAMINGVNDSDKCAIELVKRLSGMLCHVNLIPMNEVRENQYKKSNKERLKRFYDILYNGGLSVTVRRTLGSDISASCGQLRLQQSESGEGD